MKHICIIIAAIIFVLSFTPTSEAMEEYDRITTMCEDAFPNQRSNSIACFLINSYAMNKTVRLYIDGVISADQYKDCHKFEYYFPEYRTFWYVDVLECLEGEK